MTKGIKVLVCGGRDYDDRERLCAVLDELHRQRGFGLVVHGAARGADTLAGFWAASRDVPVCAFQADWHNKGKAAGIVRNQQMLDWMQPDLVVAFFGRVGTGDMMKRARDAGVEVVEVAP